MASRVIYAWVPDGDPFFKEGPYYKVTEIFVSADAALKYGITDPRIVYKRVRITVEATDDI